MKRTSLLEVVQKYPDLVDRQLYLFPPGLDFEILCRLTSDGNLTTMIDGVMESFNTPIELARKFNAKVAAASFANDLFLEPGRKRRLRMVLTNQQAKEEKRKNECDGFKFPRCFKACDLKIKVRYDGDVIRSDKCCKTVRRRKRAKICVECYRAAEWVSSYVQLLRDQHLLCYGIGRKRFQALIESRKWESERKDISLVRFVGNRLFAQLCNGQKMESNKYRCLHCLKALKSLQFMRYRLRQRPTEETNRLLFSRTKYLSASDRAKKAAILENQRDARAKKFNIEMDKLRRRLRLAEEFVPVHVENRSAVLGVVSYLNKETERQKNPVCGWMDENDAPCGFRAVSADRIWYHVNDVHMTEQKSINSSLEPLKRSYRCCWINCRRKSSFKTWKNAKAHLQEHTGTSETKRLLEIARNQLINSGRSPTGRRYVQAAKDLALAKYRSRRSWELARQYSGIPMISGTMIRRLKNMSEVTTGVWTETMARMNQIAEQRPWVRHGILICDEVYVRESISFHSSSKIVYGYADDNAGQLATKLLVFQYLSIMSKRRFRANVAVFACAKREGLAAEQGPHGKIMHWFLRVGHSLESHGFHLHGLVCDGDAKNRKLQNQLSDKDEAYGDDNTENDCGIVHPFSSAIPRFFLFSDPTHGEKKLRNNECNPKRSLRIPMHADHDYDAPAHCIDWRPISWDHVRAVKQFQDEQLAAGHRIDRYLTEAHVNVENFEKMNLKTAVDVFSWPIEQVMEDQVPGSEGTRRYMRLARTYWLAMNDRRAYTKYASTARLRSRLHFVADRLREWHDHCTDRKTEFITNETYSDIVRTCKAVPGLIDQIFNHLRADGVQPRFIPRMITQDLLERDFGAMRQACGGATNPPVQAALYGLKTRNASLLFNFALKCPAAPATVNACSNSSSLTSTSTSTSTSPTAVAPLSNSSPSSAQLHQRSHCVEQKTLPENIEEVAFNAAIGVVQDVWISRRQDLA